MTIPRFEEFWEAVAPAGIVSPAHLSVVFGRKGGCFVAAFLLYMHSKLLFWHRRQLGLVSSHLTWRVLSPTSQVN